MQQGYFHLSNRLNPKRRAALRAKADAAFKDSRNGFAPEGCVKISARLPVTKMVYSPGAKCRLPVTKYETTVVIHEREQSTTPERILSGTKQGDPILKPLGRAISIQTRYWDHRRNDWVHVTQNTGDMGKLPRQLTRQTANSNGEPNEYRGRKVRGKLKLNPEAQEAHKQAKIRAIMEHALERKRTAALETERKELVSWLTERPKQASKG